MCVRKCYYIYPSCSNLLNFASNTAFKSLFALFRKHVCIRILLCLLNCIITKLQLKYMHIVIRDCTCEVCILYI